MGRLWEKRRREGTLEERGVERAREGHGVLGEREEDEVGLGGVMQSGQDIPSTPQAVNASLESVRSFSSTLPSSATNSGARPMWS